jgi:hypothetical protein
MRLFCACLLLAGCGFKHGAFSGAADDTPGDDAPIDAPPDVPPNVWWDETRPSRMPLTITNTSTTESLAAGYQVSMKFTLSGTPCTARDDVRIVHAHTTELDRTVDDVPGGPFYWFKLVAPIAPGAASTGDYFIYCGNPTPSSPPAVQKNVFDFFDGFTAALDTNVWTVNGGATVTSGKLVVGNAMGTNHGIVTTTPSFTANHAVDFIAQAASASNNVWWAGFENSTVNQPPWLIWYTNSPTIIAPAYRATTTSVDWEGTSKNLDTSGHLYSIENFGDHAIFKFEDAVYETHTYDVAAPAAFSVRLWNYNSTPTVSFDMIRVRQAIDPAPTVSVGAVETKP